MDNNLLTRIVSRATLLAVALSLVICLGVVPRASAQDNQRVSPSQAEPAQPPAMQRQDTNPNEPKAEPEMNNPNAQEMGKQSDQDRDRSRASQGNDMDITQQQIAIFDQFLDKHPGIERDLQKNPSLVNDQHYVSSHKELEEFLENHPKVREELKEHPQAFMSKERHNDRHDNDRRDNERKEDQRPPQF